MVVKESSPKAPAEGRTGPAWLAVAGIMLVSTLLLLPGLHHPLLFDDLGTLNFVRGFDHWTRIWGPDSFGFFRPIKNLWFYILERTAGENPLPYHLGSLACFHLATLGVFLLVRQLTAHGWSAVAAAALWALSATNVTIAHWASAFNIPLAIAAMTAGLALWDRWREDPSSKRSALGCFALLGLAFLSYESALAAAPLAVLIDLYRGRPLFRRAAITRYAGLAALALAYVIIRQLAGGKLSSSLDAGFTSEIERWQVTASAPWLLWTHFTMWLAPWGRLEILGSYLWDRSVPALILPVFWAVLVAVVLLCWRFWREGNLITLGVAWFLAASIPSGNFIPLMNTPVTDYYVPLPSVGLVLAIVGIGRWLLERSRSASLRLRAVALTCLVAIVGARLGNLTAFHGWVSAWGNPTELMLRSASARPHQYFAKTTAAQHMLESGDIPRAAQFADSALQDTPDLALTHMLLGEVALQQGRDDGAFAHFSEGLVRRHISPGTKTICHHRLAQILSRKSGEFEQARSHFIQALRDRSYPDHVAAVLGLADLHSEAGQRTEAIEVLKHGLDYHPDDPRILAAIRKIESERKPS